MAHHASKFVKCPYYHSNDNSRIKCEGLSEGNAVHLVFEDSNERASYMKQYCYSIDVCKYCLIHNALNDKWGVDDE